MHFKVINTNASGAFEFYREDYCLAKSSIRKDLWPLILTEVRPTDQITVSNGIKTEMWFGDIVLRTAVQQLHRIELKKTLTRPAEPDKV